MVEARLAGQRGDAAVDGGGQEERRGGGERPGELVSQ